MGAENSRLKRAFDYFDLQGTGSITYDTIIRFHKVKKKYQRYYNTIFYEFFNGGKNKDVAMNFEDFILYCQDKNANSSERQSDAASNRRHSGYLIPHFDKIEDLSTSSQFTFDTLHKLTYPQNIEEEIEHVTSIVDHMNDSLQDIQNKNYINFNQIFGLKAKDPTAFIINSNYINEHMNEHMKDYISEQEVCLLLDYLVEKNVNMQSLFSQRTVQNNMDLFNQFNQKENPNASSLSNKGDSSESTEYNSDTIGSQPSYLQTKLAKLLIKEYDITHSGKLCDIEYISLIQAIKREIKAHNLFVGANLRQIGDYIIGKTLGFGKTAICKCAIRKDNKVQKDQFVCLKIMKQQPLRLNQQILCETKTSDVAESASCAIRISDFASNNYYCKQVSELCIMKKIPKEVNGEELNIVQLKDDFTYVDSNKENWQVLVMTLCSGGSLAEYRQSTVITEPIARYLFYQIVLGVQQLHALGIAHLDLRLENILIDSKGNIKICDFGNSLLFDLEQECSGNFPVNMKAGIIAGTLSNMPPEMLLRNRDFSAEAVDVYDCGIILYELLTGHKPFRAAHTAHKNAESNNRLITQIINNQYEQLGLEYSKEARDLINQLLCFEFQERPTINQILNSDFLQLTMHKPAIAKGIILIDPAPCQTVLQEHLVQSLNKEQLKYEALPPSGDQEFRWRVFNYNIEMLITCEVISQKSAEVQIDSMLLAAKAIQSVQGQKELENIVLRSFQQGDSACKLTFYLKNGMAQEFQRSFRKMRFQVLNNFSSLIDRQQQERIDENPAVEQIVRKQNGSRSLIKDDAAESNTGCDSAGSQSHSLGR